MPSNGTAVRTNRLSRWIAGGLVAGAVGLVAVSGIGTIEPTLASWQRGHYNQTTLAAGTLNAVPTVSCVASGGLLSGSIPIKWTAPTTGIAPTSYTIVWAGTAGSGQFVTGTTATTGSVPGSGLSVLGQSAITVYATAGSWYSPVPVQSLRITTISALGLIVGWDCVQNT
jgi:hypothetical protein